jgi:molybdopterin-binding protein
VLLNNIAPGSDVRVELADGSRVEGIVAASSVDALSVAAGKFRKVIIAADIVSVRLRVVAGMRTGKAFGLGAAVGGAILIGMLSRLHD